MSRKRSRGGFSLGEEWRATDCRGGLLGLGEGLLGGGSLGEGGLNDCWLKGGSWVEEAAVREAVEAGGVGGGCVVDKEAGAWLD